MDKKRVLKSMVASVIVALSFVFCLYDRTYAVAPTPPSRQGYSSSVYFEAVTYDFDESGGTGSGIGRYTKVQRVSVRFTDLAAGLLYLTPTWDTSVTSSIKQLVTSNIRCYDCTVTYNSDENRFYIRPAGTMQLTFEVLYPNYATSALSFNITPFFTFKANNFDDSELLGYEIPVYDRIVHSDLSALYTETHDINSAIGGISTDVNTLRNQSILTNTHLQQIKTLLTNNQSGSEQQVQDHIDDLSGTTNDLVTQGNRLNNLEDDILTDFDSSLQNINTSSLTSLLSSNTFTRSANWLGTQMTNIVQGSGTSLLEWTFIFPLIIGIVLLLIGRLR